MVKFHCTRYPELVVKFSDRTRVKFHKTIAEVADEVADRLEAFAERHPEYEIVRLEVIEEPEPKLTDKQRVQAAARERDLDDSGTVAEIRDRIAAFEQANSTDNDESDADESDADGSDDSE